MAAYVVNGRCLFSQNAYHYHRPSLLLSPMDDGMTRLMRCDIAACEAMCCHDGVYLRDGEEESIKSLVTQFTDLRASLPEIFIEDGFWRGELFGRKTATRSHNYKNPNFPAHFPKTRCVFGDSQGFCSLEKLARRLGLHPWQFKPTACWLFPLHIDSGIPVPPPLNAKNDPYYTPDYPGYVSVVLCGRHNPLGPPWWETLRAEVDYLTASTDADHHRVGRDLKP